MTAASLRNLRKMEFLRFVDPPLSSRLAANEHQLLSNAERDRLLIALAQRAGVL